MEYQFCGNCKYGVKNGEYPTNVNCHRCKHSELTFPNNSKISYWISKFEISR